MHICRTSKSLGMKIFILLFLSGLFSFQWIHAQQSFRHGVQVLSSSEFLHEHGFIQLTDLWRFTPEDNAAFAEIDYNDSELEIVSTLLAQVDLDFLEWENAGWFRLKIIVESSLTGKPFALDFPILNGQVDVYLDGEKLKRLGESNGFGILNFTQEMTPYLVVFPKPGAYTIAVRYENENVRELAQNGLYGGFRMQFYEANRHITSKMFFIRTATLNQFLFTGSLLVFAIIHLLLFIFYPSHSQNLYFALFTLCLSFINLISWQLEFISTVEAGSPFLIFLVLLKACAIIFFLRFAYAMYFTKLPVYFWIFTLAVLVDAGVNIFFNNAGIPYFLDVILFVICLEIIRITALGIYKKRTDVWIFGTGIIAFILAQVLMILNNYDIIQVTNQWLGVFGVGSLLLAMSVSLSRNVANTTNELKNRLEEVKRLSDKTLEQERINREQEVSRRLLEVDNQRKTKELEDARRLQLSMLPDRVPKPDGFEISVKMITASEVGGDYYDFYIREDGSIIAAVGDATGHGLKAGMIVATVRSYFHTLAGEGELLKMLSQISVGIRNMNLNRLYMGLSVIKLKDSTAEIVSAGMPQLLHISQRSKTVHELRIKGLPLGGTVRFPYKSHEVNLESGDILIAMSDGLIEAFNENREQFSIERMSNILSEHPTLEPDKMIRKLVDAFRTWTGKNTPDDDITLLCIRKK